MKQLVAVCMLMFALSLPVYAGHVQVGDRYCACGTVGCVEDYPGECSGTGFVATQPSDSPSDITAEIGILIVALTLWYRLKA